ncbi:DUF3168 domain-containing protein [Burkholderia sp. R-69980]|nr:DUF3168 domain-containing protein [Burkholderia sp. R-69980]
MIDDIVFGALRALVPNKDGSARVYPDIAPQGTARPYITYQSVGGQPTGTLEGVDSTRNCRVQINVWADKRKDVSVTMESVIVALCGDPVSAIALGEPASVYEEDTKLRGSMLDFSIWYQL